jgi:hypothetical protein
MHRRHDKPITVMQQIVNLYKGGIPMCKTNFTVVVFYDGTRSAKEVVNDAIASKVRRKIDNDIEIPEGKEYNQDNTQEINYPSLSGLCG